MKTRINFITAFTALFLQLSAWAQTNPLNSYQKINQALKDGTVTADEAVGYEVLAFYGDPALPSHFISDEGSSPKVPSDLFLRKAMQSLPKMPEALASRVYLYYIPEPFRPEGNKRKLFEAFPVAKQIPNQDWAFVDDLSAEIRVWYLKTDANQAAMAALIKTIVADEVIPAEKGLMGRTHLRDDLNNNSLSVALGISRKIPNGGDGKLDIYLQSMGANAAKGVTYPYSVDDVDGVGCAARPSYIAMNYSWASTVGRDKLSSTLAHEYFHVLQNSYNRKDSCPVYDNIDEGTATYMKQYVYPRFNDEHEWWEFSEEGTTRSLIDSTYESWIFYYWLVESHGRNVMPTLHTTMEQKRPMEALDAVLNGGFKKQWPEYLVYEWNQEPLQDGFKFWDNYTAKPGRGVKDAQGHLPPIPVENITLDQNGQYRYLMNFDLKPLTRDYYAFKVVDPNIRSIAIENPIFWNGRKAKAKVMVRKKGATQFDEVLWEDTQRSEYHYCLDKKNEEIDLIVIAVGNFQHLSSGTTYQHTPSFKATNQPCYGFRGKMESEWNFKKDNLNYRLRVSGFDFEFVEGEHGKDGVFKNNFYATSGRASYDFQGTAGDCVGQANGGLNVILGPKGGSFTLASYNVAPEAWGHYVIGVKFENPFIEVTFVCPPPRKSYTTQFPVLLGNSYGQIPHHLGNTVYRGQNGDHDWTNTWDFVPFEQ